MSGNEQSCCLVAFLLLVFRAQSRGRQTPERRLGGLQDGVWGREPEEEGGSSGLSGLLQVYPEQKEKVRGAYARPTPGGRAASGG